MNTAIDNSMEFPTNICQEVEPITADYVRILPSLLVFCFRCPSLTISIRNSKNETACSSRTSKALVKSRPSKSKPLG